MQVQFFQVFANQNDFTQLSDILVDVQMWLIKLADVPFICICYVILDFLDGFKIFFVFNATLNFLTKKNTSK